MTAERPLAIQAVCPFRLVVDEDLDQLNREITMSDAATGSTLFEEGDSADGVAAILDGSVEVLKHGRILATLGPGRTGPPLCLSRGAMQRSLHPCHAQQG